MCFFNSSSLMYYHHQRLADKYNVLDKIGEGGFATIYHVVDNATKKPYALKRITALYATHTSQIAVDIMAIFNEIALVTKATDANPNHIVHLYDAWCEFKRSSDYECFMEHIRKNDDENSTMESDPISPEKVKSNSEHLDNRQVIITCGPNKKFKVYFYLLFELCKGTFEEYVNKKLSLKNAIPLMI